MATKISFGVVFIGGDYTREFVVQWNNRDLDLFEYKENHEIELVIRSTYVLRIVDTIKNINDDCYVYLENCPTYRVLNQELSQLNIKNGICYDAERWLRHIWQNKLPQMNFISYWEHIRPPRLDEIEQMRFTANSIMDIEL